MSAKRRYRTVRLTESSRNILEKQRRLFIAKFGREPRPDDPVFFDPAADTPQQLSDDYLNRQMREAAQKAGIDISGIPEDELFDTVIDVARADPSVAKALLDNMEDEP